MTGDDLPVPSDPGRRRRSSPKSKGSSVRDVDIEPKLDAFAGPFAVLVAVVFLAAGGASDRVEVAAIGFVFVLLAAFFGYFVVSAALRPIRRALARRRGEGGWS